MARLWRLASHGSAVWLVRLLCLFSLLRPLPTMCSVGGQLGPPALPLRHGSCKQSGPCPHRCGIPPALLCLPCCRTNASCPFPSSFAPHTGVSTAVPQVWVKAVGIASTSLDTGSTEIDTGGDPTAPLFYWPYTEPQMGDHGWAFERTSAGYAWGGGFTGGTDPAVRICLIGAKRRWGWLASLPRGVQGLACLPSCCCCRYAAVCPAGFPCMPPVPQTLGLTSSIRSLSARLRLASPSSTARGGLAWTPSRMKMGTARPWRA